MIVVIQCAARKRRNAGYFRSPTGEKVFFVARPETAPSAEGFLVAHPDSAAPDGMSWREHLVAYNERGGNPFGLLEAGGLYENRVYSELLSVLNPANIFILSAGWGLLRSDSLTPQYDITFSASIRKQQPWKHRSRSDRYSDFTHLPDDTSGPVFFLGGKDYVALFCELTRNVRAERTVEFSGRTRVPS